jgi:DNA-binding transcriptional regulator YdaS (Cro superfamily)
MQDICPSPNKNANVFIRTLHDACVILGGEHKLAEYLGVQVAMVEQWLKGVGKPPDGIFLRCADLIHQESLRPVRRDPGSSFQDG